MPSSSSVQASSLFASLRDERNRFVAFAFTWADVLFELASDGRIVYAAGATEMFVGRSASQLIGNAFGDLAVPAGRGTVNALLAAAARGERIDDAPLELLSPTAAPLAMGMTGYRLPDMNGHLFLGLRRRIDHARAMRVTDRDQETGLLDTTPFIDSVSRHLATSAAARGQSLSLIRLHGLEGIHRPGRPSPPRELLQTIGSCLRTFASGGDLAARIGPDGLAILHGAEVDLKKLEQQLLDFARDADPKAHGLSVEATSFDMRDVELPADEIAKAMFYLVNRFRGADEDPAGLHGLPRSFAQLSHDAMTAIGKLRDLVSSGNYKIVFQPIVHATTGAIDHYEALARFPANTGLRGPGEHIALAEEVGLISEFDIGMARKVVDWLARKRSNSDVRVAVNMSGQSLMAPDYRSGLDEMLGGSPWLQGRLSFEITESSKIEDLCAANEYVLDLRARGYEMCLDDFGAGAANFQYLASLDVDIVKFDGGAVRAARRSGKGLAFLKSLVGLCQELQISTVIEMVDSQSSLEFARRSGADYVQGYLFGKPNGDIAVFPRIIPTHLFGALQAI